ncbi:Glycosyl transferase family 2 [Lachnospiraceae bacterium NE2001]|nr:Glycosyl transferase family 2 [Lachnospiraceae bacterium NE2001]
MLKLTIVMPCYNEGTRIYRNIIETLTQVEKFQDSFRLLVVNDGSTDETESEIRRAMATDSRVGLITYKDNKGKGYAVRRGIMSAKSEYVAFLDADLELPPYLLDSFMKKIEGESETGSKVGIVIGSKMHPDSQVEYPPLRKIMSTGYYIFLKIVFGLSLRDTQTGIKLFRTDIAQEISKYCRCKGYSFDIEMLAIADKLRKTKKDNDFTIEEMPVVVNFSRNKDNKSKIKMRSVFVMVRDTLRIKMYVSKLGF